jgi:hypothetical protein
MKGLKKLLKERKEYEKKEEEEKKQKKDEEEKENEENQKKKEIPKKNKKNKKLKQKHTENISNNKNDLEIEENLNIDKNKKIKNSVGSLDIISDDENEDFNKKDNINKNLNKFNKLSSIKKFNDNFIDGSLINEFPEEILSKNIDLNFDNSFNYEEEKNISKKNIKYSINTIQECNDEDEESKNTQTQKNKQNKKSTNQLSDIKEKEEIEENKNVKKIKRKSITQKNDEIQSETQKNEEFQSETEKNDEFSEDEYFPKMKKKTKQKLFKLSKKDEEMLKPVKKVFEPKLKIAFLKNRLSGKDYIPETIEYEIINNKPQEYFGLNNRYPLRHRISRLNHVNGEQIKYRKNKEGYDEIVGVTKLKTSYDILLQNFAKEYNKKNPKKRLVKGIKENKKEEENENTSSDDNINTDYNKKYSEKDDDEFITNYNEQKINDTQTLIIVSENSKTNIFDSYDNINLNVSETTRKNKIVINGKIYNNVKKNKSFKIYPNYTYQFFNYADNQKLKIILTYLN